MIYIAIYLLIGCLLSRGAWTFCCERYERYELIDVEPAFFFGAVLWPLALFALVSHFYALRPLFRLIDALARRLAKRSQKRSK